MNIVYIAGPITSATPWGRAKNIARAKDAARQLVTAGIPVFCPHSHSQDFGGLQPNEFWYAFDIYMLKSCSALLLLDGWEDSRGACSEYFVALMLNIPIFHDIKKLKEHIKPWRG